MCGVKADYHGYVSECHYITNRSGWNASQRGRYVAYVVGNNAIRLVVSAAARKQGVLLMYHASEHPQATAGKFKDHRCQLFCNNTPRHIAASTTPACTSPVHGRQSANHTPVLNRQHKPARSQPKNSQHTSSAIATRNRRATSPTQKKGPPKPR